MVYEIALRTWEVVSNKVPYHETMNNNQKVSCQNVQITPLGVVCAIVI